MEWEWRPKVNPLQESIYVDSNPQPASEDQVSEQHRGGCEPLLQIHKLRLKWIGARKMAKIHQDICRGQSRRTLPVLGELPAEKRELIEFKYEKLIDYCLF
ncbi:hypothetical protein LINGRAHAP2_LOCUS4647 [Linum grandiflorum]